MSQSVFSDREVGRFSKLKFRDANVSVHAGATRNLGYDFGNSSTSRRLNLNWIRRSFGKNGDALDPKMAQLIKQRLSRNKTTVKLAQNKRFPLSSSRSGIFELKRHQQTDFLKLFKLLCQGNQFVQKLQILLLVVCRLVPLLWSGDDIVTSVTMFDHFVTIIHGIKRPRISTFRRCHQN